MAIVLGIDPGSRITGYGLIDVQGSRLALVDCGCIRTESPVFPQRLQEIFAGLCQIIDQHMPTEVAIEEVFMGRNPASALKLGQARGSALVACLQRHLPVAEYAPRQIKLALVGRGGADKAQVQHMVKAILGLQGQLQADAADALAVAICHAHTQVSVSRMAAMQPGHLAGRRRR